MNNKHDQKNATKKTKRTAEPKPGWSYELPPDQRPTLENFKDLIRDQRTTLEWTMVNVATLTDGDLGSFEVNALRSLLIELMKSTLLLEDYVYLVKRGEGRVAA